MGTVTTSLSQHFQCLIRNHVLTDSVHTCSFNSSREYPLHCATDCRVAVKYASWENNPPGMLSMYYIVLENTRDLGGNNTMACTYTFKNLFNVMMESKN